MGWDVREAARGNGSTVAQQGHAYDYAGTKVIALESGENVRVAEIRDGWLGARLQADAAHLEPLPMAYFHGQVPG
ncbi:MAG: hypothetical protein J0H69_17025 [Burkholderiales bacterium]|nr:hypothetical protein [Burkholderiales bacterium]